MQVVKRLEDTDRWVVDSRRRYSGSRLTDRQRYRTIVQTAFEQDSPVARPAFVKQCQSQIVKPDTGEQYTESYIKRIVGAYVQVGALSRDTSGDETILHPSPFADELLDGNLPLPECVWKSLKRRWVAMGKRPEGIEGLIACFGQLRTLKEVSIRTKFNVDYLKMRDTNSTMPGSAGIQNCSN